MNIIYFMIGVSVLLGLFFLMAFLYAVKRGQFDDLTTQAYKILKDDEKTKIDKGENSNV